MKKLLLITLVLSLILITSGCLLFQSVAYEIKPDKKGGGSAVVTIKDLRSDAIDSGELDMDKENLFEYMYQSDEFINQMKDEGKSITSRELIVEGSKLSGKIKFSFGDIELVEGIIYQDPYYFLTIPAEDSIISTNGEVIVSEEHKRIMWDNSIEVLKFTMFSDDVESGNLIGMAQFHNPE
ncbi:MAG: hypothetical protein PVF17_09775 [Ignavibacteria bacterium]|jgi:hypothetical protein